MNATSHRSHPHRPAGAWVWLLPAAALLWAAGCARHADLSAFLQDPCPLVTSTEYRLAPPDTILLASKRVREINGHVETIRPDGRITLPLLGSHFVAGKTPEEVSAELQVKAREFYQDSDVNLRVLEYRSKKIFIWGEVGAPGPYAYDGTNTIFRALAQAQPTRLADFHRVEVVRPGRDGQAARRMTIDLEDMVQKGDLSLNGVLEEGDVIWVPPNPLAAVGLALQQLLLPIQPAVAVVQGPAEVGLQATGTRPYGSGGGIND